MIKIQFVYMNQFENVVNNIFVKQVSPNEGWPLDKSSIDTRCRLTDAVRYFVDLVSNTHDD